MPPVAPASPDSLDDPASLELSPDAMRAMGEATLERAIGHLATLSDQPAAGDLEGIDTLCRALREGPPEQPVPLEELLRRIFDEYLPRTFTSAGPGYLGYVPGGGLFPAALADLIQATTNRYTGVWQAAPLLVQLEANVLDWFREWMQLPPSARGLLTVGGSMAAFNAIVCGRERHLGPEIRSGVMYASTEVHHSVVKAARLAGIHADRVRSLPVDRQFRLQVPALAEAVRADRAAGLKPFLVVASAGTVNTGAVDPLDQVADLCAAEGLWLHVDGAYGAFFHLCPELRPLLAGLPRADSLTLDPHKGLFLPYGTGALLVRDGAALRAVHAATAGYLPASPDEFYDPCQYTPDLTRGFPGLRVWLCLKVFGAARFRAAIREKRELALWASEAISRLPGFVLDAPPQLSLFAFHLSWPGASREEENAATRELLEAVRRRGKVLLTGCQVEGRFLARVCVLSFRTRRQHVETCVQHLTEEGARILASRGARA